MNIINLILFIIFVLGHQLTVFALEPSTAIKATVLLKETTSWDGQLIVYPKGKPEITGVVVEIPPGSETGWHMHPVSPIGVIIEGNLEIRLKNGLVKQIKAGDMLVEVANTLHNGRNIGSVPVKIIVFYIGAEGQKLSIP